MGSIENDANDNKDAVPPVVHKFGDEELSDVTFIVGGEHFKCHRMVLANRSAYFKVMFFSNFKEKDQETISIEGDPVAFKKLMEIVYIDTLKNWNDITSCYNHIGCKTCRGRIPLNNEQKNHCQSASDLWIEANSVLKLADQYDMLGYVSKMIEGFFLLGEERCSCAGNDCARHGVKLIIGLIYEMNDLKEKSKVTKKALLRAMEVILPLQEKFTMTGAAWHFLMTRQ